MNVYKISLERLGKDMKYLDRDYVVKIDKEFDKIDKKNWQKETKSFVKI